MRKLSVLMLALIITAGCAAKSQSLPVDVRQGGLTGVIGEERRTSQQEPEPTPAKKVSIRCGAKTKTTGAACRARVKKEGDRCFMHRATNKA